MDYTLIYCGKCEREVKVLNDVILSYSGQKDVLCSTCGNVLLKRMFLKWLKKDLLKGSLLGSKV